MRLPTVRIGDVFDRLTVTSLFMLDVGTRAKGDKTYRRRERHAAVRCSCGSAFEVLVCNLKTGNTKSCGCTKAELSELREASLPLYRVWASMKQRCNNQKSTPYKNYGGRGIRVCVEWQTAKPFIDWAQNNGYSPGLTIERIDNNGDYAPSNCRFASRKEQSMNTRLTMRLTAFGETKCCSEWAQDTRCMVSAGTLRLRIHSGREPEEAIATPSRKRGSTSHRLTEACTATHTGEDP